MKGYIFCINDNTVTDILEGSKEFVMECAFNLLKNNDNTGLSFDDDLLTITTDTDTITEGEC